MTRALATLGLALALASAGAPAIAKPPGPRPAASPSAPASPAAPGLTPERRDDDAFPFAALAPVGLSAGYVWMGRWERALLVPLGVYTLVFVGGMVGLLQGLDRATWKDPIGSVVGVVVGPLAGAGLAFGASSAAVLLDQALLPHAGGPWMAPGLTAGTVVLLFAAHGLAEHAATPGIRVAIPEAAP